MRVIGYFHVAMMDNWKSIFCEILQQIESSGLYDLCAGIRIGLLGNCVDGESFVMQECARLPKMRISVRQQSTEHFEFPTLQLLKNEAVDVDGDGEVFCFYLHTKGASVTQHRFDQAYRSKAQSMEHFKKCSDAWREYMLHFNVSRHRDCLQMLDRHDVVGVDLYGNIYVGNFWWSKFSYVRRLPDLDQMLASLPEREGSWVRFYAERWIGWKNLGTLGCLWTSEALEHFKKISSPDGPKATLVDTYYTVPILRATYDK